MTRLRSLAAAALLAAFLGSVYALLSLRSEAAEAQAAFTALSPAAAPVTERHAQAGVPDTPSDAPAPAGENAERFSALLAQNEDFAAWLNIEGTRISYPVMFTPEEPDRYLHRDFAGQESVSGTPYIGRGCTPDSNSLLIYGHNMKDGTMFSDLLSYEKERFFREHPSFSFDTVMRSASYDVLAVFREKIHYQDEVGVFRYYDYAGELTRAQFEEYLSQLRAASLYDTGCSASYGDRLVTLSTCAYHTENGRFVVVGVERKP